MSSEDESEIPDTYCFNNRDRTVIATAILLLEKILRAAFIAPAEIVSVAKVLHVLKRLPQQSAAITVSTSLTGPRRMFGEHEIYHYWHVNIIDDQIEILSGGHFYRESTGGDSFTCLRWNAEPALEAACIDYLAQNEIVDDAQPFDQEIDALDLTHAGYNLSVTDEDNPLLEENTESVEMEAKAQPESVEVEYSESELQILAVVYAVQGRRHGEHYSNPSDACDLCRCNLQERAFFVDGRLRGQIAFACMCAECFLKNGEGIGCGQGQIYQREPDGEWLLVAGFPPKEQQ